MNRELQALSRTGRQAAQAGNWADVARAANRILKLDNGSAEGHFLSGLARRASNDTGQAAKSFSRSLKCDPRRYDAAIELALLCAQSLRNDDAVSLLERYVPQLGDTPLYLDRAGSAWSRLGMHERAWPLFRRANELQPGVPSLMANLAASSVFVGRIEEARDLYERLLEAAPEHQRYHYQLSRILRATDSGHVDRMRAVLDGRSQPPERNIFLYYALGKELEDLEQWDEAWRYYQAAGDAAAAASGYRVETDIELIDTLIDIGSPDWLAQGSGAAGGKRERTPIFVVGLPRTGTTLTDRILSSHPAVDSADESRFLEIAIEQAAGRKPTGSLTADTLRRAAAAAVGTIGGHYLDLVSYRLGDAPLFVEKLPENVLYLGFVAREWPDARIVCLRRNPMDTCFALYKQSFFRYAYRLDDLARYYVAHDRLVRHWRNLLGDRFVELEYERLASDQEAETRRLLDVLGLDFDPACLAFEKNLKATATASAAQVREKMHTRSIGKWRHFAAQLEPLRAQLAAQGIDVGD